MPLLDNLNVSLITLDAKTTQLLRIAVLGYLPILLWDSWNTAIRIILWLLFAFAFYLLIDVLPTRSAGSSKGHQEQLQQVFYSTVTRTTQPEWMTHHELAVENEAGRPSASGTIVHAPPPAPLLSESGILERAGRLSGHWFTANGKWAFARGMNLRS